MKAIKTVIIASKNKNKKKEIMRMLKTSKVKVESLDETHKRIPIIVEDGKTYRQNAIKKAVIISRILDAFVIADDSGLEVRALGGRPGVRSARFAKTKATDKENNDKLLKLMASMPMKRRGATFVCVIAIANKGRLIRTLQGKCEGRITLKPKGISGFGYDPLFIPDGYKQTFAEMKPSFKNKISHRARALKKTKEFIGRYL